MSEESDDLLVVSKKTGKIMKEKHDFVQAESDDESVQKYDGKYYSFVDYQPKLKKWSEMDEQSWNLVIGFILIRFLSPLILVLQTVITFGYMWFKFRLRLDNPILAKIYPYSMASLCLNLLTVQFVNKWLFNNNYYKLRDKD